MTLYIYVVCCGVQRQHRPIGFHTFMVLREIDGSRNFLELDLPRVSPARRLTV